MHNNDSIIGQSELVPLSYISDEANAGTMGSVLVTLKLSGTGSRLG